MKCRKSQRPLNVRFVCRLGVILVNFHVNLFSVTNVSSNYINQNVPYAETNLLWMKSHSNNKQHVHDASQH